jgi:two-component system, NtrC family, nitrogen regulation sensor histidine kinase NtrY
MLEASALDAASSRPDARLRFDQRILLLALASGLPAAVVGLILLWTGGYTPKVQWTLTVLIVGVWTGCSFSVRQRVVLPLQTLSNLLAALRESDFSIRARGASGDDPLGAVMLEVNVLASTLHDQRLGALEAGALLRTVMVEIDVAVFTFDGAQTLRLVNRAGERLLAQPAEQLLGRTADELGLRPCLIGHSPRIEDVVFPGGSGRYEVRRTTFRQGGRPHQLLVLADVSRPLRDEERQAWQRLIRVMGHELNNSLAPIQSVAQSLESGLAGIANSPEGQTGATAGLVDDMKQGFSIIRSRTESLGRFMAAYSKIARLPAPKLAPVEVRDWVLRVVKLETRVKLKVEEGPAIVISGDGDQLEQLLINLVHNAAEAVNETGGGGTATIGWSRQDGFLNVLIADEGPGISNPANLFVPFFTTKQGGTGIGLVLCRQIAEAHGGTLTLENRRGVRGCEARLRLPL